MEKKTEKKAKSAPLPDETPVSPENGLPEQPANPEERPQTSGPMQDKDAKEKKGSRGPSAGKYQNGRACFSAWFDGEFLVRLRRYALRLGHPDVASLIRSEYRFRLDNVPLSDDDLAEIEEVRRSVKQPRKGA